MRKAQLSSARLTLPCVFASSSLLSHSSSSSLLPHRGFSEEKAPKGMSEDLKLRKSQEMNEEAEQLMAEQRFEQAELVLIGALGLSKTFSPQLASKIKVNLAFVYHNIGQKAKARTAYDDALQDAKKLFGADSLEVGLALGSYAELLYDQGEHQKAVESGQEALKIFEAKLGPEDVKTGLMLSNLAGYQAEVGRLADAKETCQKGLRILVQKLGRDNQYTASCYRNLKTISKKIEQGLVETIEAEWQEQYNRERDEIASFAQQQANQQMSAILNSEKLEEWRSTKKVRDMDVRGIYIVDRSLLDAQKNTFEKYCEVNGKTKEIDN